MNEGYAVTVSTVPTMVIVHDKDDISVRSLDTDTLDKLILRGDINEEARRKLVAAGDLVKGIATKLSEHTVAQLFLQPGK